MEKNQKSKLKALSDISSIDLTLEFDIILQRILKITCETMNAHSGTMMLVDEDELRMVSSYGLPNDYIEKVYKAAKEAGLPLSSSPSGTVLKTGKCLAVSNIYEEPKNRPWYHIAQEFGFSAQIFTPMKRGSKVIGLLNIYFAQVHDFSEEEINFVNIAASQASSVVLNARMCSKLKDNILELKEYEDHLKERINKTHNALYESENYLRTVIESSMDGIFVLDEEGRFEFGNDSFVHILGWPRKDLIGQFFMKIIPEDLTDFMLERWGEIQTGIEKPYETRIVTKSGEIRNLFVSHSHTVIKGKKKYVVVIKDISEKKRLEISLKESESKFHDLFENAEDPMYTHDLEGIFLSINKAGLKHLGCSENEVIGTHISKWLTPESFWLVEERIKKIYCGEPLDQPVIIEVICKNGTHKWGEVRTSLIRQGNKIIGTHGIARDITEKIILEQQIRESELKYRDMFENAQDPMYTINMNGTFLAMNNVGLNALGATKDEVIGSNLSEWLTPESMEIAMERLKEYAKGINLDSIIYEIVRKDGEHKWIEAKNRLIKHGGRITSIHGIARDVTEKKRLEQKVKDYHEKLIKSYEELIETDNIKTEFISNITHELLTPLTSIRGFAELIDDETMGKINPEQKKSLGIILRNSDRLIKLIKELLDSSNLEKNKLGLHFRIVSINSVLSKSIQDIHPQANDKQITIIKDFQHLPDIWGDEERLIQVIMNLLINAIKFTPPGGKITIRASDDKDQVKISITDTGIGIPEEKLKTIFDRFYQVDGSSSRKYGGVGLGLSICKNIIDKHYGKIWAQSNGQGSTFHIVLPELKSNSGEKNV